MIEYRSKNRILALIMVIMLVVGILPVHVANGEPETEGAKKYKITITVNDDSASPAPIQGANVTYKLTGGNGEIIKEGSVKTGSVETETEKPGIAEILITDDNNVLSRISEDNKACLSYYVEKIGDKNYASVYKEEEIVAINTSENPYDAGTITLKEVSITLKEGIALEITSAHGSVKVNNVPVTLDESTHIGKAYVASGEEAKITIDTEKGYKLGKVESIAGGNTAEIGAVDNVYALTVSEENITVNVNYIDTFNLKVAENGSVNGTVKFCEQEITDSSNIDFADGKYKDELEANANGTAYVVIKPKEGYRAAELTIKKDGLEQAEIYTLSGTGNQVYEINEINNDIQVSVKYVFLHTVTIDSSLTTGNESKIEFVDADGNVMTETSLGDIDDGATVKIKITPQTGHHVDRLYINNDKENYVTISNISSDKDNPDIITGDISINSEEKDINITADFLINEYSVSYNIIEGKGEIKIDDKDFEEGSETTVKYGEHKITVIPQMKNDADTVSEDYRIESIKIGEKGADFNNIAEEIISDNKEWTKEKVEISKNTEIQVTFVRVYTATVSYNAAEGTVTTQYENEDSYNEKSDATDPKIPTIITAVLNKNGKLKVTVNAKDDTVNNADSIEKYRINAININNSAAEAGKYNDDKTGWEGEFTADNDYNIVIEFAKYKYTVKSAENVAGGKITISPLNNAILDAENKLEIGESVEVTIIPEKGKNISFDSIKINGNSITGIVSPTRQNDGDGIKFEINKIKENIEVSAEFTDIPESEAVVFKDISISDSLNIVKTEKSDTYIYSEDTEIRLSTKATEGIRIYGYKADDADTQIKTLGGGHDVQAVNIANNTVITEIQVFNSTKNGTIGQWEKVTMSKNIKMVYDVTPAEIIYSVNGEKINEKTPIYNKDIKVNVSVDEKEDEAYSGIKTIKYVIVSNYQDETEETIKNNPDYKFTTVTTGEGELKTKNFDIDIKTENFNSSNTAIIVFVTDNAGNETVKVQKLDIDATVPVIAVEYFNIQNSAEGTKIDDSNVCFDKRQAVITITERDNHFEVSEVSNVKISATRNGEDYNVTGITWTDNISTEAPDKDTHVGTINFADDGNYTVKVSFTDEAKNQAIPYEKSFAVDTVAPIVEAEIVEPSGALNNDSVDVRLRASDVTSNIDNVIYEIIADGKETKTLKIPVGNSKEWETVYTIDKTEYNVDDIVVRIHSTDVCKRTSEKTSVTFSIDITAPVITIYGINDGAHYQSEQTATVRIQERKSHFEADKVDIQVSTNRVNNGDFNKSEEWTEWTPTEGSTPDETIYETTVTFTRDAVFDLSVNYTDKAGNKAVEKKITFVVDGTEPSGSISAEGYSWTKNLAVTNKSVILTHSESDITSDISDVSWYKSNSTTVMTRAELENIAESEWKHFDGNIAITDNDRCVVYMRVRDYALNTFYTSTSGIIVDTTAPAETVTPNVTITPEQPVNGLYNRNVNVAVSVTDPVVNGTFSGISSVTYNIYNMGTVTQNGTLYSFNNDDPTEAQLQQTFEGSIIVDAALNNSNDVVIEVTAQDNAGNSFTRTAAVKIDITQPAINISYNNNAPDSGSFYMADRIATIIITERNFSAENVNVAITNTDGVIPTLSNWEAVQGTENGDNTTHTATITYSADGDYTFSVSYSDLAGNESTAAVFEAGTQNPTEFTIDKTLPIVNIQTTDGTVNGAYIQDSREAVITIQEHNFTADRVSAMVNGAPINIQWNKDGDTHTASYRFTEEGEYQNFNVIVSDMAGNQGETQTLETFYIDTQIPDLNIVVADNQAYDDNYAMDENGNKIERQIYVFKDGSITISYADTYYETKTIKLTKTRYGNGPEEIEVLTLDGVVDDGSNITIPLSAFENSQLSDGLYQLDIGITDKSGRENPQTVYFTINRFGSVYIYDSAIMDIQNQYRQEVAQDFVITEYNADKLEGTAQITITKDGTKLSLNEGTDYTIAPENKSEGWYQYIYTIKKDIFSEDGIYKLSVTSRDAAGNNPENLNANMVLDAASNEVADKDIVFYIDTTKPEITSITGMDENIFNENEHQVTFTVFDAIGLSDAKDAVVVEINGEKADISLAAGENDAINRTYAFTMTEGTNQAVVISVTDKAANMRSTSDDDFNPGYAFESEITVSTNFFIRWFANRPLFFGSIGGAVAAVGGGTTAFVVRRKRLKLKLNRD